MTAYLLTAHLFQLALPAAALACGMVALASWLWRGRQPLVAGWRARCAFTFLLNLIVSVAGLVGLGADGRMFTYGGLVLVSALAQFLMWRAWRA